MFVSSGGIVRSYLCDVNYYNCPHINILLDLKNTQGIIFVADSSDRDRISEAREELQRIPNEDELRDALLLVFANKQDLPNAMSVTKITDKLGLHNLRQQTWHIQVCFMLFVITPRVLIHKKQAACATSGVGLYEELEWLADNMKKRGT